MREYVGFANAASASQVGAAQRGRERLAGAVDANFTQVDFLLTPATQMPAFSASGPVPSSIKGMPVDDCTSIGLSFSFNLSGHRAISVPAAMTAKDPHRPPDGRPEVCGAGAAGPGRAVAANAAKEIPAGDGPGLLLRGRPYGGHITEGLVDDVR